MGTGQDVQQWGGRRKHSAWGNHSKVRRAVTNTVGEQDKKVGQGSDLGWWVYSDGTKSHIGEKH